MADIESRTYTDVVFKDTRPEYNAAEEETLVLKQKAAALERAWRIRNFEIELYWKRALYFWGFIALTFTAYFVAETNHKLLIASAGLVFSFSWFLVNKASKFWQENWECHIDCLEDEVEGRLYKTVMKNKVDLINILKGYHFSVSKINQSTNVFVIVLWAYIFIEELSLNELHTGLLSGDTDARIKAIILIVTTLFLRWFWRHCRTSFTEDDDADFEPLEDCKYTFFNRRIDK